MLKMISKQNRVKMEGGDFELAKAPKKRKRKEPVNVSYEVQVHDWEAHYHFGIAPKNLNDIIRGAYWETSNLTLHGKILSPALKRDDCQNRYFIRSTDRGLLDRKTDNIIRKGYRLDGNTEGRNSSSLSLQCSTKIIEPDSRCCFFS